jgi:hypothetical protein
MGYYGAGDYYRRGDFFPGQGDLIGAAKSVAKSLLPPGMTQAGPKGSLTLPRIAAAAGSKLIAMSGVRTYRRMNPLNPRALRRALRRAQGFAKFARKTMHFVHPRPHSTRFKFPKRRKR